MTVIQEGLRELANHSYSTLETEVSTAMETENSKNGCFGV
jgi:hypothetical protein